MKMHIEVGAGIYDGYVVGPYYLQEKCACRFLLAYNNCIDINSLNTDLYKNIKLTYQ